jgi:hypothetical protein
MSQTFSLAEQQGDFQPLAARLLATHLLFFLSSFSILNLSPPTPSRHATAAHPFCVIF